jgi:predicted amidohydrolase YtcJ
VVLADNPFGTVPERIADIPVLATVVDGTPTYQSGDVLVPGR